MAEQLGFVFDAPKPRWFSSRRTEPFVWVARLLVLRERQLSAETVVREIRLRRGLNILWARPSPLENNRLFDGRLMGHTAGKTTFCRLIRYVLGEPRFGTQRVQERIRESELSGGWVVAEVFVGGEAWVVGRPFALNLHPFAARGRTVEEALAEGGAYQDFLDAVNAATVARLPAKMLPSSAKSIDWALLLTWLTRDQEARFAAVEDWRAAKSESESPSPPLIDRSTVVRSVLDVVSDGEAELSRQWEELARAKEEIERATAVRGELAMDARKRLAAKLAIPKKDLEAGPLFVQAAGAEVRARRAGVTREQGEEGEAAAAVAEAERAKDDATEARGKAAARVELLREGLEEARARLLEGESGEVEEASGEGASGDGAGGSESERQGSEESEGSDPEVAPAAAGRCNVLLSEAREKGCPLAHGAAVATDGLVALEGRRAMEARRNSARAESEKEGLRLRVGELSARLEGAQAELARAQDAARECNEVYLRVNGAFVSDKERVAGEKATIEELERLVEDARKKGREAAQVDERRADRIAKMLEISEQKAALRRTHGDASARLSQRFEEILQALLGDQVRGEVKVSRDGVEPVVLVQGERESAAMDTVKVLAFDLAALSLGIDNQGFFPGFLLHDGPREADMDQAIYERLFLYAKDLEAKFGTGAPAGFQYIVTTTTAPPKELQTAPWLLDPVLDASTPEGRLLKMNL